MSAIPPGDCPGCKANDWKDGPVAPLPQLFTVDDLDVMDAIAKGNPPD